VRVKLLNKIKTEAIDMDYTYAQLIRMKKKRVVRLCGYGNIKDAYRDLGNDATLSKKFLARQIATDR
jgi:hypothetical protein